MLSSVEGVYQFTKKVAPKDADGDSISWLCLKYIIERNEVTNLNKRDYSNDIKDTRKNDRFVEILEWVYINVINVLIQLKMSIVYHKCTDWVV